jgi:hypothetical protein
MSILASGLLDAWERGYERSPIERALLLLAVAEPGEPLDRLARLSIGDRDARLLTLRERAFGRRMGSRVACPACATQLEFEFTTDTARVGDPPAGDQWTLQHDGYEVCVRRADSTDLAALAVGDDSAANVRRLLGRCVLAASRDGRTVAVDALPAGVVEHVSARLADIDPQADVRIEAACPSCANRWHAPFDIVAYLWAEIDAWACRMLRDVHALAAAYGWREAEILALSPVRRQVYLDLIQS